MFLGRAGYFYNRDLWEYVSGERATETVRDSSVACVHGDEEGEEHLDVWYFPPKLPELNGRFIRRGPRCSLLARITVPVLDAGKLILRRSFAFVHAVSVNEDVRN